ncbi:MAG: hypothetical protein M3N16_05050 [Actinomycetota bacterium]|nr:hypothetical protein [Actinomycetota bacterium]
MLGRGVASQADLAGPVGAHHVHVALAAALAPEGEAPAVGRPGGTPSAPGLAFSAPGHAIGMHRVDLAVAVAIAHKRDPTVRPREGSLRRRGTEDAPATTASSAPALQDLDTRVFVNRALRGVAAIAGRA